MALSVTHTSQPAEAPGAIGRAQWVEAHTVTGLDVAAVDGLQAALDAKSDTSHNHTGVYSPVGHDHSGVYEPADATILKDADIGVTVAAQGHNHAGVYEPADATILKDADIGVTVAAQGHNHTGTYDPAGTASSAISAHEAAANPHPTYLTQAEGDALYATTGHNHTGTYQPLDTQLTDLAGLSYAGNGSKYLRVNAGETGFELATLTGGGDVTGQASSVDNEIALFSGTGGKTIKRATTTGVLKASSGVIAAAVSGTDYAPATSGTGILKGNGSGGFSTATAGTDYGRPYTLVATLSGDQATGANTTPVTLTGLSWSYDANSIYFFDFRGLVSPAAATTGCGFQIDLSSAVTEISMQFFHQLANTGTLSGGHSIADDASVGVSSGLPGTSTYPVSGFGMLRTGANTGTAQLRFRSETTAVITAKAGITLVVSKVA